MNNTNDTTPRRDAQEDVIELGVASVETKGPGGDLEFPNMGTPIPLGISEE
ncbi:benenodin family lasso peptide [Xanthomonas hortorum]|uniref:benenodin family lasso peptide n=1 Tax=Xanthomonas hortorum TaxID=56454 RepID=UPI0011AFFDB1|nr:benenodin family lasso peptide [Xanthomonas hortorum]MCE4369701.1 benenodin family lasso peptide [Xanthomonas hortorum pv. hederae]